jgi:hypothetical protein
MVRQQREKQYRLRDRPEARQRGLRAAWLPLLLLLQLPRQLKPHRRSRLLRAMQALCTITPREERGAGAEGSGVAGAIEARRVVDSGSGSPVVVHLLSRI